MSNSISLGSTARTRPIRITRARNAQKQAQKTREQRPASISTNNNANARTNSNLEIQPATGECPPYNDHFGTVEDHSNHKVYLIGGFRCGTRDNMPTSDFSVCDTNHLTFRKPHAPFSREEQSRCRKPLPRISFPGFTLLRIAGVSYVALLGGYDAKSEQVRSNIIIIDPAKREWWTLSIEGEGVAPRISPAIVAIGNCIYVFSGYRRFGDDPQPYDSYSIAEYFPEREVWRWSTRDQPYSGSIPPG
ncbi:hypothetical protein BDN70DRAFT_964168 [Pholiota conissans]|uniref:Kelch repeat-containing protein n=1 Tax=Pholiota conissans TaxID=109636 RepID=A0A9P6CP69_9AGAR|nr:hypothetical protein BDN70DRAFT_964168 [Pholiota conissans]